MRSSAAKIVPFRNIIRKPDGESGAIPTEREQMLCAVGVMDRIRLLIWDETLPDKIRQERGIPRRPGHIIAACNSIGVACHNLREMDNVLLHQPYRPSVDEAIMILASQVQQVLVIDWYGVDPRYVETIRASAVQVAHLASERRTAWILEHPEYKNRSGT